jgi:hypothetical protein
LDFGALVGRGFMPRLRSASSGPTFWERQFAPLGTELQLGFDVILGIVLPLFCLMLDPIVFRAGAFGRPLIGEYAIAGKLAMICGMVSLAVWLLFGKFPALFVGLLAGGAALAAGLAVILLPLSLMGLVMLIGVLGFTPFVTAFVFLRNAIRAYERASRPNPRMTFLIPILFGLAISCGGPLAAQSYIHRQTARGLELVVSNDTAEHERGLRLLKPYAWATNFDPIVRAYEAETDEGRRKRLEGAFRELTGNDVEDRLTILND